MCERRVRERKGQREGGREEKGKTKTRISEALCGICVD